MSESISRAERRAQWMEWIEAWQESGQSVAAFCREHDLVYSQFTYWRRQLSDVPEAAIASGEFVAIAFEEERPESCGVRVRVRPDLELVLERGFDEAELVRAARALLAC